METKQIKFWDKYNNPDEANSAWDIESDELKKKTPLKTGRMRFDLPGIRSGTRKNLRFKAMTYLMKHDEKRVFPKYFLKRPITYSISMIQSYLKKKAYERDGDFFLYGIKSNDEFKDLLHDQDSILAVGFSYCHKPFECPSERFTEDCIHDAENPVCRQCFIGKCMNSLPDERTVPMVIPTVHYIGEKMFELTHQNPGKKILFIITACELTLEMFADWGNMIKLKGIGVRLDGMICNTMKAFEASEEGVKPGLTVVLDDTEQKVLDLLMQRRKTENS